MRQSFLDALKERVLVFDGAMGTMLYSKGIYLNRCFDELNISSPDLVRDIHQEYLKAGADILETNTFGANRYKLEPYGFRKDLERINVEGVKLAREVAEKACYVAGALGPLGKKIGPELSPQDAYVAFLEQGEALLVGGVDFFVLETFADVEEIVQAIKALKDIADLPVVAQMTLNEEGRTPTGVFPEEFTPLLEAAGAEVVGLNCSLGPQLMVPALERMLKVAHRPLVIQPNAGMPRDIEGRYIYLCSPEYLAEYAKRYIQMGVRLVGGCCGTTPQHIKAVRAAVKALFPARQVTEEMAEEALPAVEIIAPQDKSRLAQKLIGGRFVKSVELTPPRGHDLQKILTGAQALAQAGVDAINIPDGPRASARMSALVTAYRIQQEAGLETVLHYTCRDRNLLGMQADLLGAYSLGIRNLLIITGDPPKLGDYPDAAAVYDVDSIGLVKIIWGLNRGYDWGCSPIGKPTGFLVGVGVNPGAINLDHEIQRFEQKIEAGAEFAITQPVFDPAKLINFIRQVSPLKIPVLAGIWPLASFRNAQFMHNEVPGAQVPDALMERMRAAEAQGSAAEEGILIAQEALKEVKAFIQGVQVSAPLGRYQTALEVLKAVE
jgi:homocysteine S-methyltransferase